MLTCKQQYIFWEIKVENIIDSKYTDLKID